jgi:hypothetical protein
MKGRLRHTGVLLFFMLWSSGCDLGYPTSQWGESATDHLAVSGGFQLLGVHQDAPCAACHDAGDFALKFSPANEEDCLACHLEQYRAKHGARGYPTDCTLCHAATAWSEGGFSHEASAGGFDLWGPHADLACTACHVPETFEPRYDASNSGDCGACH